MRKLLATVVDPVWGRRIIGECCDDYYDARRALGEIGEKEGFIILEPSDHYRKNNIHCYFFTTKNLKTNEIRIFMYDESRGFLLGEFVH